MFSGIVEEVATLVSIEKNQSNIHLTLSCSFAHELKVDQSIAHNGVCLTVVSIKDQTYTVTAIQETLDKSNLGLQKVGSKINLERSIKIDSFLDGHLVQGHVDQTAQCTAISEVDGSWYYSFAYNGSTGNITVEKGSITVNGVSLTVVNSKDDSFQVAIIPYTYQHTNFNTFKEGTVVNLEFDLIGKYITRLAERYMRQQ